MLLVQVGNLLSDLAHFGDKGRSVAGHPPNFPAGLVSVGAESIRLRLETASLLVKGDNFVDGLRLAPARQRSSDEIGVSADEF